MNRRFFQTLSFPIASNQSVEDSVGNVARLVISPRVRKKERGGGGRKKKVPREQWRHGESKAQFRKRRSELPPSRNYTKREIESKNRAAHFWPIKIGRKLSALSLQPRIVQRRAQRERKKGKVYWGLLFGGWRRGPRGGGGGRQKKRKRSEGKVPTTFSERCGPVSFCAVFRGHAATRAEKKTGRIHTRFEFRNAREALAKPSARRDLTRSR